MGSHAESHVRTQGRHYIPVGNVVILVGKGNYSLAVIFRYWKQIFKDAGDLGETGSKGKVFSPMVEKLTTGETQKQKEEPKQT